MKGRTDRSLYATWLGILLAATFGATRTLP